MYLKYINKHPVLVLEKPMKNEVFEENIDDKWYVEYINIEDMDDLAEIILVAQLLELNNLMELGCAKIGSLIKALSVEEKRKFFKITNDFTPEEETLLMEENQWALTDFENEKNE